MGERQWFVLYVLVCLEVGIFLMLVPWSAIWERNYFLQAYPGLRALVLAPAFRGAVCGLGLANIYVGVSEILSYLQKPKSVPSADSVREPRPPLGEHDARGARDERARSSEQSSSFATTEEP